MSMKITKPIRFSGAQGANLTVGSLARELGQFLVIARAITFHPEIELPLLATRVEWNPRFKHTAGQYSPREKLITLHPGLRYAEPSDLIGTFLHEVAHVMQVLTYRKCDHGETWWEMMHQLGQRPKRTHSIPECHTKLTAASIGLTAEGLGL